MNATIRRLAIAAAAAGALGAATTATAHADDHRWISVAYSPVDGASGIATGSDEVTVMQMALDGCLDQGGADCTVVAANHSSTDWPCLAVGRGAAPGDYLVGEGATRAEAERAALTVSGATSTLVTSQCAVGNSPSIVTSNDAATPAAPGTATVTSDVDVYEVPDGIGTPYPGIFLNAGDSYTLVEPCRDSWCHLQTPGIGDGTSWVYQDGFLEVS